MSGPQVKKDATKVNDAAAMVAVRFKPPLKPQRRLFIALLAVFGAWVVFLLALYFKTVYPLRHH